MTQTVTVQSWTIQAVPNPANLQATGENIDTPAHSKKKKKKQLPQTRRSRSDTLQRGRNWRPVSSITSRNTKQILGECSQKKTAIKSHFFRDKCITVMWNWAGALVKLKAQQPPPPSVPSVTTGPRSALQEHFQMTHQRRSHQLDLSVFMSLVIFQVNLYFHVSCYFTSCHMRTWL